MINRKKRNKIYAVHHMEDAKNDIITSSYDVALEHVKQKKAYLKKFYSEEEAIDWLRLSRCRDFEIGRVTFPPEIMTKLCSQGHPGFYTKPKEDYTEFELELANYEKNIDYI